MSWLWLATAGVFEVVWVVCLRHTNGFTRWWPSVATCGTMAVSLFCMSQALRLLPMGTVYAVWTGIGAAGGLVWGIMAEGDSAAPLRIACVGLILAGVVGLKLGS